MANNIQKYRKQLGLSQDELAQKLLVSRQTISQWETGQTVPTTDNLIRLKEIFGVSIDALLGYEAETDPAEPAPSPQEHYVFKYNEKETKQVFKRIKLDYLMPAFVMTCVFFVLTVICGIAQWKPFFGVSTALFFVCVLVLIVSYKNVTKTQKTGLPGVLASTYEYSVFSDSFSVVIRKGDNISKVFNGLLSQIDAIQAVGDFLLINAFSQVFILRKSALASDSVFLRQLVAKEADLNRKPLVGIISRLLVVASVSSICFAVMAMAAIEGYGFFESSWVFYLFLLLPITSIVFGVISGKRGFLKNKKNIVVGIIFAVLLLVYGTLGLFAAHKTGSDTTPLTLLEEYTGVDFPQPKTVQNFKPEEYESKELSDTMTYGLTNKTYVFFDDSNKNIVTLLLSEDAQWMHPPKQEFVAIAPSEVFLKNDYVLLYDLDREEINRLPEKSGSYHLLYVTYTPASGLLEINEYILTIS